MFARHSDMLTAPPSIPVSVAPAPRNPRGAALLAARDMGALSFGDAAQVIVDGLTLANWSPEKIEALANLIGRKAHIAGRI